MTNSNYISRKEIYKKSNYIKQGLYQFLYSFFKNLSFPFANYIRYGILKLFLKETHSTYLAENITFWFPWQITIGRNTSINTGCVIDGTGNVIIGNDVRIAAYVIINSVDHKFTDTDTPIRMQAYIGAPVIIEDDVWIGANVIINKGVTIGKGSVIGAGSVVTKDIPPYSVAVGVPCKVIKSRK